MLNDGNLSVKFIHCGNINIANPEDQGQKNIFFMPMGLIPIANVVKQNGFAAEVIHTDLEYNKKITEILDFNTLDMVGFDCHWINQALLVMDMARLIKQYNPDIFIFLGGYSASLFAEEIVADFPQVDAVIRGDGEVPVLELCKAVFEEKAMHAGRKINPVYRLANVQNLVWKKEGSMCINPFSYVGTQENMDKLDFAAFDLLRNWWDFKNLSRYYSGSRSINADPMFLLEVGRGCPYACTFCGGNCVAQNKMNNRRAVTLRSTEAIVQTLEKAQSLGFGTIYTSFEFEGSDPWFVRLLESIKAKGIRMNYGYGCWRIPPPSLIDALSDCCKEVVIEISPETGNLELRKLNKDKRLFYTNEELENCLDYISTKENVKVQVYFGYYLVNDTEATILETLRYIIKLLIKYTGLVEIEYANFSTDPGSLLFFDPDKYDIKIKVRHFRDYIKELKENYVEIKKQSPDLTLYRPRNINDQEAFAIDKKIRLLNYIFATYRKSISYLLLNTGTPDVLMELLNDSKPAISLDKKFIPEDVRDILIKAGYRIAALNNYLLKTINTEFENQKSRHKISKPTTQLYLIPPSADAVYDETQEALSCTGGKSGRNAIMHEMLPCAADRHPALKKYWEEKLSGEITPINLDKDYAFTAGFLRKSREIVFDRELNEQILENGNNENLSVYAILLAAFKILILKCVQQKDITVVSPLHNGSGKGEQEYVILRDQLDSEMTFRELLSYVKETVVRGYDYQAFASGNVLAEKGISSHAVQKIIVLMKNVHDSEALRDVIHSSINDLTFEFTLVDGFLSGELNYNSKLFADETIRRISDLYIHIIRCVFNNPDRKLLDLDFIPDMEKKLIIHTFNKTCTDYPKEKTLHQLFEDVAGEFRDNIAIESEGKELTYKELDRKANQLAAMLKKRGVKPGSIVGIMVNRSVYMAIGILAILKAGGAYLPLDPNYPVERINYMLADSDVELVITRQHLHERLGPRSNTIFVDQEDIYTSDIDRFDSTGQSGDLAYIIYTSGSTGLPKGVMISHRNLVNQVSWRKKAYGFSSRDCILQLISYSFDGFGANFYSSILSGGKLIIVGDKDYRNYKIIKNQIKDKGITYMGVVPSIYRGILENALPGDLKSLRFVTLAGEKANPELIKSSNFINPDLTIVNEYGPTENTIATTVLFGLNPDNTSVIGRPIDNNKLYILDQNLKLMPVGFRGELFVAGDGLAQGYLKKPEYTEEKFISNLYSPGERLYRTGDFARWLADGNVEFLGRADQQIKIRGFRIEIGEIEAKLLEIQQIKEAIVIVTEDCNKNKYLCAYLVADEQIDPVHIRECLLEKLPDYMIPALFIQLECLPLTPNGKIDTQKLPVPDISEILTDNYAAPENDLEIRIQEVWQQTLGISRVGVNHDFFILGGNSLKAMKIVSLLEKELAVDVTDIYAHPTIRKLSVFLRKTG